MTSSFPKSRNHHPKRWPPKEGKYKKTKNNKLIRSLQSKESWRYLKMGGSTPS